MGILQSKIYYNDMQRVFREIQYPEKLVNSKILITGATGLVCSGIVDLLVNSELQTEIYVAGRNAEKAKERFGNKVYFIEYDATKPIDINETFEYIIHGASNASPDLYLKEPVETMKANIYGMQNLLEFACNPNVKKVIYISSSEIYGKKESIDPFKENQYGFVDILNPRSSYSIAKRATETMCIAYKMEYGVDVNIVRLGHIYGPTINKLDKRVSSDFAFKAARGEDLILKSKGEQIRSYCYSLDCASAVLTVLTSGISGEAYNISNRNSVISIKEMAEYLAQAGGVSVRFELPNAIEESSFNPMSNSSLDSSKIEKLGWRGVFDAREGLNHTVQILKGF